MRTRDLDVWVDVSHSNKPIAGQCISAWVARYPLHAPFLQRPVSLRSGQQIKFPDADVFFLGTDELPKEISPADGIDVLTSIKFVAFDDFFQRVHGKKSPVFCFRFLHAQTSIASVRRKIGKMLDASRLSLAFLRRKRRARGGRHS
jgi:hypothetical protein